MVLDEEEWVFGYHLEEQLVQIYRIEEEYWCRGNDPRVYQSSQLDKRTREANREDQADGLQAAGCPSGCSLQAALSSASWASWATPLSPGHPLYKVHQGALERGPLRGNPR